MRPAQLLARHLLAHVPPSRFVLPPPEEEEEEHLQQPSLLEEATPEDPEMATKRQRVQSSPELESSVEVGNDRGEVIDLTQD